MLQQEQIKYLQRFHKKDEHLCVIIWQRDDIIGQAREGGIKCSNEEADEIVEKLERNHDASIGISWNLVDDYLFDLKQEHEEEKNKKNAKEKVEFG